MTQPYRELGEVQPEPTRLIDDLRAIHATRQADQDFVALYDANYAWVVDQAKRFAGQGKSGVICLVSAYPPFLWLPGLCIVKRRRWWFNKERRVYCDTKELAAQVVGAIAKALEDQGLRAKVIPSNRARTHVELDVEWIFDGDKVANVGR